MCRSLVKGIYLALVHHYSSFLSTIQMAYQSALLVRRGCWLCLGLHQLCLRSYMWRWFSYSPLQALPACIRNFDQTQNTVGMALTQKFL